MNRREVFRITPQTSDSHCLSVVYVDATRTPMLTDDTQLVGVQYSRIERGTLVLEPGKLPEFIPADVQIFGPDDLSDNPPVAWRLT